MIRLLSSHPSSACSEMLMLWGSMTGEPWHMASTSGVCAASLAERPAVSWAFGSSQSFGPLSISPLSIPAGCSRLLTLHFLWLGARTRLGSSGWLFVLSSSVVWQWTESRMMTSFSSPTPLLWLGMLSLFKLSNCLGRGCGSRLWGPGSF